MQTLKQEKKKTKSKMAQKDKNTEIEETEEILKEIWNDLKIKLIANNKELFYNMLNQDKSISIEQKIHYANNALNFEKNLKLFEKLKTDAKINNQPKLISKNTKQKKKKKI